MRIKIRVLLLVAAVLPILLTKEQLTIQAKSKKIGRINYRINYPANHEAIAARRSHTLVFPLALPCKCINLHFPTNHVTWKDPP